MTRFAFGGKCSGLTTPDVPAAAAVFASIPFSATMPSRDRPCRRNARRQRSVPIISVPCNRFVQVENGSRGACHGGQFGWTCVGFAGSLSDGQQLCGFVWFALVLEQGALVQIGQNFALLFVGCSIECSLESVVQA